MEERKLIFFRISSVSSRVEADDDHGDDAGNTSLWPVLHHENDFHFEQAGVRQGKIEKNEWEERGRIEGSTGETMFYDDRMA